MHVFRSRDIFEKYVIVQAAAATDTTLNVSVDYGAASLDKHGAPMRGLPLTNSVQKSSFCMAPGEYTIHAIDTAGDGWWGGGYYSVIVDGVTVVREEMNRMSSMQSTAFTVALPVSARAAFFENEALRGGGGGVFWEDAPPNNIENYRSSSGSNTALYGDFIATPARELTTAGRSFDTVTGVGMAADPITVVLKDRSENSVTNMDYGDWSHSDRTNICRIASQPRSYDQVVRSANDEVVYGEVLWTKTNSSMGGNSAQASGAIGIVRDGVCQLDGMAVVAPLGSVVGMQLSSPMASLYTDTSSAKIKIRVAPDCPRGYFLTGKDVCEACEAGKYSLAFSESAECNLCPPDSATCGGGDALVTADGWWRTDILSDDIRRCPMERNCKGGTNTSFLGKCREGSEGPLCGVCIPNFYNAGYECRACEDSTSKEFISIITLAVMLCAAVAWKVRVARAHRDETLLQSVWFAFANIVHGQRAKIAWQTIQITSSIAWTTSIKWPEPFKSFSELLTNLAELSLIPLDCISQINYWRELVIATVMPVGIVALAWLFARLAPNRVSSEKKAVTFTLFVAFVVLPMVSTKIFRTFL